MKIYFITRTYVIDEEFTDCGNIRNRYVDLLRKRYDVVVVTPNYDNDEIVINERFIRIPYYYRRIDQYAERIGLIEDYFENYIKKCIDKLLTVVMPEDIVFATTGGELAGIKIASILKSKIGCKMIVNFHDPVNYTTVNGKKTGGGKKWLHVNRDRVCKKYLIKADYIITSSDSYRRVLEEWFPEKKRYIVNIYFGYLDSIDVSETDINEKPHTPIKLVYAGSMGLAQIPEEMMEIWGNENNVQIEYIGSIPSRVREKARAYKNVILMDPIEHSTFLSYMAKEADIGLVSLVGEEWSACFPSKIFDLINLNIPVLGVLPDGDAKDKVNGTYGYVARLDEKEKCKENLSKVINDYCRIVENMKKTKMEWSMDILFEDVYRIIEELMIRK